MIELPKYATAEIERRWLVPLEVAQGLVSGRIRTIEDLYIEHTRLRIRAVQEQGKTTLFKLGKKYGPCASGVEPVVSVYLSQAEYALLVTLPGHRSIKERRSIVGGSLDVYLMPRLSFAVFEVEFGAERQAEAYAPPPFAGEEVTGNARYSGFQLAAGGSGRPPDDLARHLGRPASLRSPGHR